MAPSSQKLPSSYHVRSISLPARLHPIAKKIEDELSKLQSFDFSTFPNSKTISVSLSGVAELYKCITDLFDLPDVRRTLSLHQDKSLMNELLDISLRHLDVCGRTKDTISRINESVRELQSALRRKKGGDFSITSYISTYTCERKRIKKELSKSLTLLKDIERASSAPSLLDHLNYQFSTVVKMLREANMITSLIFRTLSSFLSKPVLKPKASSWALASKVISRKFQGTNELENMEAALSRLSSRSMNEEIEVKEIQSALKMLENAEATIRDLDEGLESLFRRMIQTRVSLLNIISL